MRNLREATRATKTKPTPCDSSKNDGEKRPLRRGRPWNDYRNALFGAGSRIYVCYGDKSEQIRHVLKDWGWVQNYPTNNDDRLVYDFMWGG